MKLISKLLLSIVLLLSACSNGSRSGSLRADSILDALEKHHAAVEKKPAYKKLTADMIDHMPDSQLTEAVFQNLEYLEDVQALLALNKPQQTIYLISLLDMEINCGGFNQYYYNQKMEFARLTPAALELIGAPKLAELAKKANKIYEVEFDKINKHKDETLEGFSKTYVENTLNLLDAKYMQLFDQEGLMRLQVDFIRKHKGDFVEMPGSF
jgi:hypothetical protein